MDIPQIQFVSLSLVAFEIYSAIRFKDIWTIVSSCLVSNEI